MLRVKDGPKSLAFYRDVLGMTCLRNMSLAQYGFSLIFMVSATEAHTMRAYAFSYVHASNALTEGCIVCGAGVGHRGRAQGRVRRSDRGGQAGGVGRWHVGHV